MIGVICRSEERPVAGELFELFKTPWELYRHGRAYDVVIATTDDVPEVDARLLLLYGSDLRRGEVGSRGEGGGVSHRGRFVPIRGSVLTFETGAAGIPVLTAHGAVAGRRQHVGSSIVMRLGYDLLQEARALLSAGQPAEHGHIPALDLHIAMLREWILDAGVALVEIPPAPSGHPFVVCLTHDIDFAGIRPHRLDHTMWGFLYRATVGAVRNVARRRLTIGRLLQTWRAVASLPFVYLGWARDFWEPFAWYLRVERRLPATYFLIPFKGRPGEHVPGPRASRRAAAYDVTDLPRWMATLMSHGCELGVHGIDAWHSVASGRQERERVAAVTGQAHPGIRIHWLLADERTPRVLEEAGYAYDSTGGYNETVGFRHGTAQPFRPPGARTLLELPLHIQDGALFYPQRLDLSEAEAWTRCGALIDHVRAFGGALTVLWHDRSHAPERFWGDFYIKLVRALRSSGAWFGTGAQVVGWFGQRRHTRFEHGEGGARTRLRYEGETITPPLVIRIHRPGTGGFLDVPWNGETAVVVDERLGAVSAAEPARAERRVAKASTGSPR